MRSPVSGPDSGPESVLADWFCVLPVCVQVSCGFLSVLAMPSASQKSSLLKYMQDTLRIPGVDNAVQKRMKGFCLFKTGGTVQGIKKAVEANSGSLYVVMDEFISTFGEAVAGEDAKSSSERAEWLTMLSGGLASDNALATKEAPSITRCNISGIASVQVGKLLASECHGLIFVRAGFVTYCCVLCRTRCCLLLLQTETLQEILLKSRRGTNDGLLRRMQISVTVSADAKRSAVCTRA